MSFKEKVQKVILETAEKKDMPEIAKSIKEKVGQQLTKDLTVQFQQSFDKYLHLKGETYIKPLIVGTTEQMVALNAYKEREEELKLVVRQEIERYFKDNKVKLNEPDKMDS